MLPSDEDALHNPNTAAAPSPSLSTADGHHEKLLLEAIQEGCIGVKHGNGGPFGAVIVLNGVVIATGHNRVLETNDPTAHAEVVAIRNAASKLQRFSLHDCVLYSSCHPCPMCLSAIIWAKIPRCFYSSTTDDAAAAGFDDRMLYSFIQGDKQVAHRCDLKHLPHPSSAKPFTLFAEALRDKKSSLY